MATYTTPTGATYSSADKIAISLIESPPTGRALSKSEKEKIAAYMARPAQERAAIEQAFLGHPVSGGAAPPPTTTPPTTPPPTTGGTPTIDIDYSRATPVSELQPPTGEERFGAVERDWQASYEIYLEYLKTPAGKGLPTPRDLNDYVAHAVEWNALADKLQYEPRREYNTYMYWSSLMKTPDDWWPTSEDDFYANYDKAQQQLTAWQQEYETSAKGVTPEKQREYDDFRRYASAYGEPGDWFSTNIEDYFANYDQAQGQLSAWKKLAGEAEQYELSPEEAARRREESYKESRYAAEERFRETPEYQPPYAQWLRDQEQFSGALQQYVEREYPSLVSQFKATQPKLTGYASREAARAGATQREQAFQAWLPEQVPGLEQKYWAQRPVERGERPWMYSPTMVAKSW